MYFRPLLSTAIYGYYVTTNIIITYYYSYKLKDSLISKIQIILYIPYRECSTIVEPTLEKALSHKN